jgi:hypothetical protein
MSLTLSFDPLLLLLDDPALLAAMLTGPDPALAPAVQGEERPAPPATDHASATPEPTPAPVATDDAPAAPAFALMPEDAFPTMAELDAMLADSYAPEPGLDAALRAELVAEFGLDPTLVDDEEALMAALAALEPEPEPEDDLPPPPQDEAPYWDPSWVEAVLEDWALG